MCGDGVPVENYMEGDGSLLAEKEKEEEVKRLQKNAKTSAKPKAVPALNHQGKNGGSAKGQFSEK